MEPNLPYTKIKEEGGKTDLLILGHICTKCFTQIV